MPLTHCQCSDDSSKCKAGFPRTTCLIDKSVVLCKGFLKKRSMPYSGKKNMVGSVHGPMNEENLNGCMSPILAGCPGLNFNNDIQIPYRFPIIEEIHDTSICTEKCWQDMNEEEMILAA